MLTKTDIARIMMKERRQLSAYVIAITRDIQSGDDLFQDVCLKALSTPEKFANENSLLRWSRVTARNTAIDALRRRMRSAVSLRSDILEIMAAEWPTYRDENAPERIEALVRCIKQLSPYNRQIVQLRYKEGLDGVEVAERMKRKVKTMYQALSRIHKHLRNCVVQRLAGEL